MKIICEVSKNRFAIGTLNRRADYVVQGKGKSFTGVRGQRPKLTKGRFTVVTKPTAALKAALA